MTYFETEMICMDKLGGTARNESHVPCTVITVRGIFFFVLIMSRDQHKTIKYTINEI